MRFSIRSLGRSSVATWVLIILVTLLFSLGLSSQVGFTMDEFLVYHALACTTQSCGDLWNRGREACRAFNLAPLSWLTPEPVFLPLRSYPYVGSIQGLFYLPLYLLWKSPMSARFFGILLIGMQSVLISKTFGQPVLIVLALLLFFMPYAFQHLVDVGQLSLCTTAVFLLVFLHKRWMLALIADRRRSWLIATGIALTNVVILLFRLNNVAYMPAYVLTQAACMGAFGFKAAWRTRRTKLFIQACWMVGLFVLGALVWFTAIDRNNVPLYQTILRAVARSFSGESSFWLSAWNHLFRDLSAYFLNPLLTARVVHPVTPGWRVEGIGLIALAIMFFLSTWISASRARYRRFSFSCLVAFFVGLISISSVSRTWGMHHLIPVFPIFIVAVFSQIPRRGVGKLHTIVALCFLAINIKLYLQLVELKPRDDQYDRRLFDYNEEINERFASSHFMIVGSWGLYYTKLLYGPTDQCLIWADTSDIRAITAAKRAKEGVKKPALFIFRKPVPPRYWRYFANQIEKVETENKVGGWALWRELPSQ